MPIEAPVSTDDRLHPIEEAMWAGSFPREVGNYYATGKFGHYIPTGELSAEFRTVEDARVWVTLSGEVIED